MSDLIEKAIEHGGITALLIILLCVLAYYINKHFVPVNKKTYDMLLEEQKNERRALLDSITKLSEGQKIMQSTVDEIRRLSSMQVGNRLSEEKLLRITRLMDERGISFNEAVKIVEEQGNNKFLK